MSRFTYEVMLIDRDTNDKTELVVVAANAKEAVEVAWEACGDRAVTLMSLQRLTPAVD